MIFRVVQIGAFFVLFPKPQLYSYFTKPNVWSIRSLPSGRIVPSVRAVCTGPFGPNHANIQANIRSIEAGPLMFGPLYTGAYPAIDLV